MSLSPILKAIAKADHDYDLFQSSKRVAVGVSGGKDRMVLLQALHEYGKQPLHHFEVIGIHIDPGFSDVDFTPIDAYCRQEGIELIHETSLIYEILIRSRDLHGKLPCSLCAKLKKGAIIESAKRFQCDQIALGHHKDDAVETLFMNMIHGGRLALFQPKMYLESAGVTLIRPMIYLSEQQILDAAERLKLSVVGSGCPNDGNTERQRLKETLNQLYLDYPSARQNFLTMLSNTEALSLWERHKKDE